MLDNRFPLAPAPKVRVETTVDSTTLESYVGVYELAPNFTLTFTRQGGALFGQATGQGKFQFFAESPTEFFLKVTEAQVTFVKDASGRVDQIILHQGGANIPGKRVK
jgi:hypothetical protein